METIEPCVWGVGWRSPDPETGTPGEFSPGISHGMSGVLLWVLSQQKEFPEIKALGRDLIRTLVNICEEFQETSTLLIPDAPRIKQGWCHGDLSVGFALIKGSQVYRDKKSLAVGLKRFQRGYESFQRQKNNLSLCHGWSGVSYLLQETGMGQFQKEASDIKKMVLKELLAKEIIIPGSRSLLQDNIGTLLYLEGSSEKKALFRCALGV
jgi:hypothetical protein